MNPEPSLPDWLPEPDISTLQDDTWRGIERFRDWMPKRLPELVVLLESLRDRPSYSTAIELANTIVWQARAKFYESHRPVLRLELLDYVARFMPREGQIRIFRRLSQDSSKTVYRAVHQLVRQKRIREVALPFDESKPWDQDAWGRHHQSPGLDRHSQGTREQERRGVAVLADVGEMRKLLKIKTPKQLGWLLTATDRESGPYVRFAIAKRDGRDRTICAPKQKLRQVQRTILDKILYKLSPHPAAHGFLPNRSIVTNAEPHIGAKLLIKFDLRDFFPTIHWSRVLGLFTSIGYYAGNCRLSTQNDSKNVALMLTRICTYTPDPADWNACVTPQGAPTSPAIANLICRGLDARLTGLAERMNGVYTRYADDLTFSFRESTLDVGRFRWWVDQICHQEGFFIHQNKLRVIRAGRRQKVTGIVINETMRIPREQRRRFRAILHNCQKHGLESQRRDRPDLESYLRGFASYVYMVHPDEGEKLLRQVDALLGEAETG